MKTNFDQSSTGVNLELACVHNTDLSRIYFDDDIEILEYAGITKGSLLLYTEGGEFEDFEKDFELDQKDFKIVFKAIIKEIYCGNKKDFLDDWAYYIGCYLIQATKDNMREFWENVSDDCFFDFIEEYADLNYKTIDIHGSCQGDYGKVIVPKESFLYNSENCHEYLNNLVFDAPLSIRLEVDEVEYYLDQELKDLYNYDKDEVLEIAKKELQGHEKLAYILEWLDDNLPEYPEYN